MKSWADYLVEMGGGLPNEPPDYTRSARSYGAGNFFGNINIGQAHLNLSGGALHIDTANHSVRLPLTADQIEELIAEFQG